MQRNQPAIRWIRIGVARSGQGADSIRPNGPGGVPGYQVLVIAKIVVYLQIPLGLPICRGVCVRVIAQCRIGVAGRSALVRNKGQNLERGRIHPVYRDPVAGERGASLPGVRLVSGS